MQAVVFVLNRLWTFFHGKSVVLEVSPLPEDLMWTKVGTSGADKSTKVLPENCGHRPRRNLTDHLCSKRWRGRGKGFTVSPFQGSSFDETGTVRKEEQGLWWRHQPPRRKLNARVPQERPLPTVDTVIRVRASGSLRPCVWILPLPRSNY